MSVEWPAITSEELRWDGSGYEVRSGYLRGPYLASVPATIAGRHIELDPETTALSEDATLELTRFDESLSGEVAAFGPLLLRSEAVASSQIEHLAASARQVLTAELGDTGRRNAQLIVANTRAMQAAIALSDDLSVASVLRMHRVLMEADSRHTPGEFRREAVWIGTSTSSPIGADFVGPHESRIDASMDDLMEFARREDLPILAQTAIAHAQFETIHPFTDGNGRTGRALLQSMLRARKVTRVVTVPVSAGLLAGVDAYHASLTAYRRGDAAPIIRLTAESALRAIANARRLVDDLHGIKAGWDARMASIRRDSSSRRLAEVAVRQPVFDAKTAARELGVAVTNVYRAIAPLAELGILQEKSEHKIGRVWRADEVLTALDAFAERSGQRIVATT